MTLVYAPFSVNFFVHMDRARVKLQTMRNCTNTTQLAIKEKCYNWLIRICFSGVLTGASLFVQCLTSLNCLKNKNDLNLQLGRLTRGSFAVPVNVVTEEGVSLLKRRLSLIHI